MQHTSCSCAAPAQVLFLQTQHAATLRALHAEVARLTRQNCDLSFQLTMGRPPVADDATDVEALRADLSASQAEGQRLRDLVAAQTNELAALTQQLRRARMALARVPPAAAAMTTSTPTIATTATSDGLPAARALVLDGSPPRPASVAPRPPTSPHPLSPDQAQAPRTPRRRRSSMPADLGGADDKQAIVQTPDEDHAPTRRLPTRPTIPPIDTSPQSPSPSPSPPKRRAQPKPPAQPRGSLLPELPVSHAAASHQLL